MSAILTRQQPQAIELEQAILGAIMLDREAFSLVSPILRPDVFYSEAHGLIYAACAALAVEFQPIDILTVTQKLMQLGTLSKVGGAVYVTEVTNRVASAANIEAHARIVFEKHIARQVISICGEAQQAAYSGEDAFEVAQQATQKIINLHVPLLSQSSVVTIHDAAMSALMMLDKRMSGQSPAVFTGFNTVDRKFGGFMDGEFTILAARPGMGKTEWALNVAINAASAGKKVHFVSLEMTNEQLAARVLSKLAGIDGGKMRRGELTDIEVKKLNDAAEMLAGKSLYLSAHRTISELQQFATKRAAKGDLDMLIVDYLQLMSAESAKGMIREQEIGKISRGMKQITRDLAIPVLSLAQLSRAVEMRQDKTPVLSDLRESGTLEQDADNVLFLHRPEYYQQFESDSAIVQAALGPGTHDVTGKAFLYSGKFRHDSAFSCALDFKDGHFSDVGSIRNSIVDAPQDWTIPKFERMADIDIPF